MNCFIAQAYSRRQTNVRSLLACCQYVFILIRQSSNESLKTGVTCSQHRDHEVSWCIIHFACNFINYQSNVSVRFVSRGLCSLQNCEYHRLCLAMSESSLERNRSGLLSNRLLFHIITSRSTCITHHENSRSFRLYSCCTFCPPKTCVCS